MANVRLEGAAREAANPAAVDVVVFDLGGVLIDWSPHYLYRRLLPDDAAIDAFLAEVGFAEWNVALDAGRDWDEAVEWLAARHPDRRPLIEAFRDRWEETLGDADDEVVAIVRELRAAGTRTLALTNWSDRTFEIARRRFPFLDWFEDIVVSGQVGAAKPDERIYRALIDRNRLEPARTVFIDDQPANVEAAARLGLRGVVFRGAPSLRRDLAALGLPFLDPARTGAR